MATEIRLPQLGESIAEGTIVRWLKAVGDDVARDDDLVLVSTDKIETELPAPAGGVLLAVFAREGELVRVGDVIAVVGEAGEAVPDGAGSEAAAPVAPAATPASAGSAAVATPATPVSAGAAPVDPVDWNRKHRDGGDPKLFVSPAVRRLVREHDVDLGRVAGTGAGGRITRGDVLAAVEAGLGGSGFVAPPAGYTPGLRMPAGGFKSGMVPFDPGTPERYAPQVYDGDEVQPLSAMGRAMAEHMAWTWWRSPHVSTIVEVDMSAVAAVRGAWKPGAGPKPSYTAFVATALARALDRHRGFNSSLSGTDRIVHRSVNLGVAVARADGGLLVPVLRDAAGLSLGQLTHRLADVAERARGGGITGADLAGGTFTLTNVGSNGNLASMPLINQPQCAILAIGAVQKRVVVVQQGGADAIAIRPMMYVTLTYDHRVNDGAASGRFLRDLRTSLEAWDEAP